MGVEPAPVFLQPHRPRLREVEAGNPALLRPGPSAVPPGERLHVAEEKRSPHLGLGSTCVENLLQSPSKDVLTLHNANAERKGELDRG